MLAPPFSPTSPVRRGRNVAPGTCGELAQGVLPDGTAFVVTCPIDLGTSIEVTLSPASTLEVRGVPDGRVYLERALRRAAELIELGPCRLDVVHRTELPVGKGMASSTADIVAATRALAAAAGASVSPREVAELAAAIEPSDGIMYEGVVVADPRSGRRLRDWAWWPEFTVVMLVPPTTFATSTAQLGGQRSLAGEYADLLDDLDRAVADRDIAHFAAQATRSARLGQAFVRNTAFELLDTEAGALGALGACAGHTGTVAGLLFARTREGHAAATDAASRLRARVPDRHRLEVVHTPRWHDTRLPVGATPIPAGA